MPHHMIRAAQIFGRSRGTPEVKLTASTAMLKIALSSTAIWFATSAHAQTAPEAPAAQNTAEQAAAEGEIIVTAQRREESIQRVPVAITAVGSEQLQRSGITNVTQLSTLVPALQAITSNGAATLYAVRGVADTGYGAFSDNAIVVNVDGVPLAHPTSSRGLFLDVERVEVLKGPQGILYGRNATGGAINFISARPRLGELSGQFRAEIGNYAKRQLSAILNVPISPVVSVRAAGQMINRSGYFTDGTGDEEAEQAKLSVLIEPSASLSILLRGDYAHEGGIGVGATMLTARSGTGCPREGTRTGVVRFAADNPWTGIADPALSCFFTNVPGVPRPTRNISTIFQNSSFWGLTSEINWENPLGILTILPAHRETNIRHNTTQSTFYSGEDSHSEQNSLEVRQVSNNHQRLRWLLGAFYLTDQMDFLSNSESSSGTTAGFAITSVRNTLKTAAIFGQLTFDVVQGLRLTAGGRYTTETKRTLGQQTFAAADTSRGLGRSLTPIGSLPVTTRVNNKLTDDATNWRVGIEWDAGPRSLVYASASTGFKAGGFFFGIPGVKESYEPETITAFVIGSKNRFLGGALTLNGEVFYNKYRGQQITHFTVFNNNHLFVVSNVGSSNIKGAEVEAQFRPGKTTTISLNGQYLDAKYKDFTYILPNFSIAATTCALSPAPGGPPPNSFLNCSGKRALQSPKWSFSGSIEQVFPLADGGQVVAMLQGRVESSRETQLNYIPETLAPGFGIANLSLEYRAPDNRWSLGAWIRNITDEAVVSTTFLSSTTFNLALGGSVTGTLQPPRTYGLTASARF